MSCNTTPSPRFPTVALALSLVGASTLGCSAEHEPPNVLFIVMDTTRADHLGVSGWHRQTTPHLSALLVDSVHYTRAHSCAPWTLPSHMSMFTGELPGVHRANWSNYDADESAAGTADTLTVLRRQPFRTPLADRMLGLELQQRGYHPVGISCNPWVAGLTGFDAGFDAFYSAWSRDPGAYEPDPALPPSPRELPLDLGPRMSHAGKAMLALNRHLRAQELAAPFLLFFNFMDPHYPYISAPEKGIEYGGDSAFYDVMADSRRRKSEFDIMAGKVEIEFDELDPFYDSCIFHVDDAIGRLVAWLKERGQYDNTMIVVTADHGEHLGEDGLFAHQLSVREELLHVPLIVKYPGNREAGTVDDDPNVSTADIYATVLGAAGASTDPSSFCRALGPSHDRPYAVAEYYFSNLYLQRFVDRNPDFDTQPHRHVRRVLYAAGRRFEFSDENLVAVEPLAAAVAPDDELERRMKSWMQDYINRLDAKALTGDANVPVLSEEQHREFTEALRSLGYVR